MLSAAAVLVCALSSLGRPASSMPPIEFVDVRPLDVSVGALAFVRRNPDTIYLITSSPLFREAMNSEAWPRCFDNDAAYRRLAGILVHEEWHIKNGHDERGAYEAQLSTLLSLGFKADSRVYYDVVKSMQMVLSARKRVSRPDLVLAAK